MTYDDGFFDGIDERSVPSAAIIVPRLVEAFAPSSVVDVGCGRGAWLAEFVRHGVEVSGYDGDYVKRSSLLIDPDRFVATDLRHPPDLGRFDLALCLEVGEHLPPGSADALVDALAAAAPVVVFSAAIPGQGGTDHVNEQWPGYWQEKFAAHGLDRYDGLRQRIGHDHRIAWWYRQNLAVYATPGAAARYEALPDVDRVPLGADIEVIHRATVHRLAHPGVRDALRSLRSAVVRSVRSRTGG
jgi:SAM-dependent methyltransferase